MLSLQNGISNLDMLAAALPGRKVLRGMVGFNVARLAGGHWHRGTSGMLAAQKRPGAGVARRGNSRRAPRR